MEFYDAGAQLDESTTEMTARRAGQRDHPARLSADRTDDNPDHHHGNRSAPSRIEI